MNRILNRITSLLLTISILLSMIMGVSASETQSMEVSAESTISEEFATQLMTEMFGTAVGEAALTDSGYQYRVSSETFADMFLAAQEEMSEELPDEAVNELPDDYIDDSNEYLYEVIDTLAKKPILVSSSSTKVEVVFIIDSTGSMSSEIASVKNNVTNFAQHLAERDISLRLGLIDYRDITADGRASTVVHTANYSNWMNVTQFISALTGVRVGGGGDAAETPIDALGHLTEGTFSWSSDAYKFAVVITDAGYKTNNNHGIRSMDDMISRLQNGNIQVSTITPSSYYTTYSKLVAYTGGMQENITSSFSTVLREYADAIISSAQPTQDYTIRVVEERTRLPIKNAQISWSGGLSTTDENGLTVVTTRNNPLQSVVVRKNGYITKRLDELALEHKSSVTVSLTFDESMGPEYLPGEEGVPVLYPNLFRNPEAGIGKPILNVSVLGKEVNLFEGVNFELDLNLFGPDKIKIEHNAEKRCYEVIVGINSEKKPNPEEEKKEWKEAYTQYKSLVKQFSGKTGREVYNQFLSLKGKTLTRNKIIFPIEGYVGGYFEFGYDAFGRIDLVPDEGGVVLGVSLAEKPLANTPLPPPCGWLFVKVTFEADVSGLFTLVNVDSGGKHYFGLDKTEFEAEAGLALTLNAGIDKLGSFGGGVKGQVKASMMIPFPNQSFEEAAKLTIDGHLVFNVQVLGYKLADYDHELGSFQLYPQNKSRSLEPLAVFDFSDATLIERPSEGAVFFNTSEQDFHYYKANVYGESTPQLIQLKNGSWLMVWVDAVPERSDNNMAALYYATSEDGSSWTEHGLVEDDGTGDFAPSLVITGDGTPVLAWQDSNKQYNDDTLTLETRISDIDVSAAVFDTETNTFEAPVTIQTSDNTVGELAVQVVAQGSGAAIYWIENSENNPLLGNGTNSIVTSTFNAEKDTWDEPERLITNLSTLSGFSVGEISNEPCVAYAIENDTTLYCYNQEDGSVSRKAASGSPGNVQIVDGKLYWSDTNGLMSWNGNRTLCESDILANVNCKIITNTNGTERAALISQSTGMSNELCVSAYLDGVWTPPVVLTEYGMSMGDVSAVLSDEVIYWVCGRTLVDESELEFGASDLIIDSYSYGEKIVVDSEAFVSSFEDLSDGIMDVYINIYNAGLGNSDTLKAKFYVDDICVGESELFEVDEEDSDSEPKKLTSIQAGEGVLVIARYPLPAYDATHDVCVKILDSSGALNGTATVSIPERATDVTVENAIIVRTETGATVYADIKNISFVDAKNISVTVAGEGNTIGESKIIDSLAVGETKSVDFDVSAEFLESLIVNSPYDYKRFTVSASTTTYEVLIGNNSGDALLEPLPVTSIQIIGEDNLELEVGSAYKYSYSIQPAAAPRRTVTWMSDNTDIVTVDNGAVTAVKPGTAAVTVLTTGSDGELFVDTAQITVKGIVNVPVSGITLEKSSLNIGTGDSFVVNASVTPANATNKSVKWSVDHAGVVGLASDSGLSTEITGLAEGEANVIATTIDGGYSASMKVIVSAAHRHTLESVSEIPATCESMGTMEHWHCDGCGKNFEDEEALTELEDHELVIRKNPANHADGTELHGFKEATATEAGYTGDVHCLGCGTKLADGTVIPVHECTSGSEWFYDEDHHWNGCTGHADCQKHLNESCHTGGTATGTEKAVCSVCGQEYGELRKDCTTGYHTLVKNAGTEATCTTTGTKEHWHCTGCGKNFSDSDGKNELDDIEIPVNLDHHTGGTELRGAKEATATEAGYTGDVHCLSCGTKLADGTVIPVHECTSGSEWFYDEDHHWNGCTGHADCQKHLNESCHTGGTATGTEKAVCSVCGQEYGELRKDCTTGYHTLVKNAGTEATCTTTGTKEHWHCTGCGKNFSDSDGRNELDDIENPVNLNHHTGGTELRGAKEVTATEAGYTGDVHCLSCGTKLADGTVIPIHICTAGSEWFYDEDHHWNRCTGHEDCQKHLNESVHTGGTATCTEKAACFVCGQPYGDAIGHIPSDWMYDKDNHWKVCVTEGCRIRIEQAAHIFRNGNVCDICDYIKSAEKPDIPSRPSTDSSDSDDRATISYTIAAPKTENGNITINPRNASKGTEVTLTLKADKGYELDTLIVADRNGKELELTDKGDNTFTFVMPSGTVIVNAFFRPVETTWSNPFADVAEDSWYYEAVSFAMEKGIMSGYSADIFAPNDNLSRAMLAQILYNLEEKPSARTDIRFTDVSGDAWYSDAVLWAAENGIAQGYDGRFDPDAPITREQVATMLWNYVGKPAADHTQALNYSDADKISGWAVSAMLWATENNVMSGYDGILDPAGQATRAQIAQMMKNYLDN